MPAASQGDDPADPGLEKAPLLAKQPSRAALLLVVRRAAEDRWTGSGHPTSVHWDRPPASPRRLPSRRPPGASPCTAVAKEILEIAVRVLEWLHGTDPEAHAELVYATGVTDAEWTARPAP